jgi:hypothetical protein
MINDVCICRCIYCSTITVEIHKDAVPEMRKCIEEASSMLLPTPPPHTYPLTEQWRLHSHEWIFMWNGVDVIVHIVTRLLRCTHAFIYTK